MVAAQSHESSKAGLLSVGDSALGHAADVDASELDKDEYLPSISTTVLHLRLLTAFSQLRQTVPAKDGLYNVYDEQTAHSSEQRWTIFIAQAVARFERWYRNCIEPIVREDCGSSMYSEQAAIHFFDANSNILGWADITPPPLDVIMVLHSYLLNPRDFLQDSLRNNSLIMWKAGFPWRFVKLYLNSTTNTYDVPANLMEMYEKATHDQWTTEESSNTAIVCPRCKKMVLIAWSALYLGNISQMEKGNTEMPFSVDCPECHSQINQSSLCLGRFRRDLELLLERDVPMPGTLLSLNGRVVANSAKETHPSSLNKIIQSGIGSEIVGEIKATPEKYELSRISSSLISSIENANTESSPELQNEKALPIFRKAATRMMAVYDKNSSPFALDLVGAVMRQGTFIEKMQEFDWVHSPALEDHVRFAIDRYIGFFKVMQQNPDKISVPTFDVDLVWHTHQLKPQDYYDFSVKFCNDVFIDHDDKIVDNVLSDSFQWTCNEYARLTGLHYDKCLCWCCGLLEAEYISRLEKGGAKRDVKQKVKNIFKRFSREPLSPREQSVMNIQTAKFEKDYAKIEQSNRQSKRDFFETYIWHYPMYAPSPDTISD